MSSPYCSASSRSSQVDILRLSLNVQRNLAIDGEMSQPRPDIETPTINHINVRSREEEMDGEGEGEEEEGYDPDHVHHRIPKQSKMVSGHIMLFDVMCILDDVTAYYPTHIL